MADSAKPVIATAFRPKRCESGAERMMTTIVVIILSAPLSQRFGRKAVAITGFALSAIVYLLFYQLGPTNVTGMLVLHIIGSIVYAPTIAVAWAMYADAADYSEWQTGRRFT